MTNAGGTNTKTVSNCVMVAVPLRYANFVWGQPFSQADKRLFKQGSTIPIKFTITDLQGHPAGGAIATLAIYYYVDGAPAGDALVVSESGGDTGTQFGFDGNGQYHYNLSTKGSEWTGSGSFIAEVTLDDGQQFTQEFFLK